MKQAKPIWLRGLEREMNVCAVFTAPAEEIQNIKVCLTICDGKVVYSTL